MADLMGTTKWGLTKFGYYADFVIVPAAIAAIIIEAALRGRLDHKWAAVAALGYVAWTLVEYLVHRFVFHGNNKFAAEHAKHHLHEADYIGVSSAGTAVGFAGAFVILFLALGHLAGPVVAGLLVGYLAYIAMHDRMHHAVIDRTSSLYSLKIHHVGHHRGVQGNFGVSTKLWDVVFGTMGSAPKWNPRAANRV